MGSDDYIGAELARELADHGTVRLPYVALPDVHPYSIGWRMGFGESHIMILSRWAAGLTPEQREDVVRAAGSVPADWAQWAARFVDAIGEDDEVDFEQSRDLLAERGITVTGTPT